MISLAAIALLALPQVAATPDVGDAYRPSLLTVDLGRTDLAALLALGLDVARVEDRVAEVVADDAERARLEGAGIRYDVVHEDLVSFYSSRLTNAPAAAPGSLGAWLSPPFGAGAMGGYYTFVEIVSVLDQISAAYPAITTARFSIGQSIQGRDLWAIKVSDNPNTDENEAEARFDALHHAREPEGMQATLWAMLALLEGYGTDPLATYLVDNRELWFVLCVNPDGYVYNESTDPNGGGMWRKNRRNNGDGTWGVDLNRNYSYQWGYDNSGSSGSTSSEVYRGTGPASEPEVSSMQAFITGRGFATALSTHTYSNVLLYPWGYTSSSPPDDAKFQELSILLTEVNGYPWGQASSLLYPANGVTFDYDYGTHGIFSWTPEIGGSSDGFWPPTSRIIPLAEENEECFLRVALAAGAYVRSTAFTRTEVGDGDGLWEAGESAQFTYSLRNSGRLAPATSVVLTLSSASPDITITNGTVDLGAVGSFANVNNNGNPLAFTINPGTPPGTLISYTTSIDYEGYSETIEGAVITGEPRPFLTDDLEVDLGWSAGVPGDDATTGIWEWGDPVGTESSGEDLNPEDDATAAPGVNCFATGNGSTSSGGDDVDNGKTTLMTPPLHLSGVTGATVSYSRWYANLGSPQDDEFVVEISDDDGVNWWELETVTSTENQWTTVSFVVPPGVDQTDEVRVRFVAEDDPNNSLTEAGIDELMVSIYDTRPRVNVFGLAQVGTPLAFHLAGEPGAAWAIFLSEGTASFNLGAVDGTILIDPATAFVLTSGIVPADGLARTVLTVPNDASLIGMTWYMQGLVQSGGIVVSNRDQVTFE